MDEQFNSPSAELMMSSSDGIVFAVHKIILELASHVFRDMFTLAKPGPISDDASPRAVISMGEDAQSLRMLLRFCYPRTFCSEPELLELGDIKRAAELARKYEVQLMRGAVEQALVRFTSGRKPDVAYAVAWQYEYPIALRAAARRSLEPFDASPWNAPEFEHVPATSFRLLHHYQNLARAAIQDLTRATDRAQHAITWIDSRVLVNMGMGTPCSCKDVAIWFANQPKSARHPNGKASMFYSWWWYYIKAVVSKLQGPDRCSFDVAVEVPESMFGPEPPTRICPLCTDNERVMDKILQKTKTCLRAEIERRIAEIPLDAPFIKMAGG